MRAVEVNVEGIRLHVEESGDGPPLLLLNGIGAHAGMWKPLQAARVFVAPGEGHLLLLDPQSRALPAIRDFVCGDEPEWGEAVEVSRETLDAELRAASGEAHPLALMSAGVRAFWT